MGILEVSHPTPTRWAHPIRLAIATNPTLAARDKAWADGELSDLAFAIEARLSYLPQIITFMTDTAIELQKELLTPIVKMHLRQGTAFPFRNAKPLHRLLFGTTSGPRR